MVRNNTRKQRTMKRDFKQPRKNEWDQDRRKPKAEGDGYEEPVTSNAAFEEYYKQQKIVPEGEWDVFLACLRTPLPTTFRINGTGKFAAELRDRLDNDFFAKLRQGPQEIDGEKLEEPRAIPWYPNKLAWQFTYSRGQLRKLPALAEVHELLKRENTAGGITRQEAVSMAPPLFLDIQSHHKILDTCAAPGSKTAQMLELLHEFADVPNGFVIANDLEPARCNLLVHQTKRMNSPALIVTNHDASTFPLIGPADDKRGAMQFDRILCDVPCSGDGTLRKAPDIWRRWNVANGTGLHPLQVRIALHTARLLKVRGRMVYSTCSFNPVEDEAVVAEVLRQSRGTLRLVDVSSHLPSFPRCPGLHSWSLKCKSAFFTEYAKAEEANAMNNLSPSMFPDDSDAAKFALERCMRVLPHHGDTGGFFIAVLEKTGDMPQPQPDRWKRTKEKTQELRRKRRSNNLQPAGDDKAAIAGKEEPEADYAQEVRAVEAEAAPTNDAETEAAVTTAAGDSATVLKEKLTETSVKEATEGAPPHVGLSQHTKEQPWGEGFAAGRNTIEDSEGGADDGNRAFGKALEGLADSAAYAAVVFADAIADEDVKAATDAAEDAAEAAEDVAAEATARAPPPVVARQPSIGSKADSLLPETTASRTDEPVKMTDTAEPTLQPRSADGTPVSLARISDGEGTEGVANGATLTETAGGRRRERRPRPGEEPLEFFPDSPALDSIVNFFGISDEFPLRGQLVMRLGTGNSVGARKLYFVSSGVREVLLKDSSRALKMTSAGLKILERNDKKDPKAGGSPYRISQDGLGLLLPHITKQILRPTAAELLRLLKERVIALPLAQRLDPGQGAETGPAPTGEHPAKRPALAGEPLSGEPPAKRARNEDGAAQCARPPEKENEEGEALRDEPPACEGERIEPQGEARRIPISDLETLRQLEDICGGCAICMLSDREYVTPHAVVRSASGLPDAEGHDLASRDEEAKQLSLQAAAQPSGGIGSDPIAFVCWRGRANISILVDKHDASAMAEKLEAAIQAFAAHHAPHA